MKYFSPKLFLIAIVSFFVITELHEVGHALPIIVTGGAVRFTSSSVYTLPCKEATPICSIGYDLSVWGGDIVNLVVFGVSLVLFIRLKKSYWLIGLFPLNFVLGSLFGILLGETSSDEARIATSLGLNPALATAILALLMIVPMVWCFFSLKKEERIPVLLSLLMAGITQAAIMVLLSPLGNMTTSEFIDWYNNYYSK